MAFSDRWRGHPGVRSGDKLTVGERAADRMRASMGSWGFVFSALLFLAGWMIGNRGHGFDPYPFILLNLVLSCLAAMQGAILLIAAKRADQISAELATHDYQTNLESEQIIKEVHRLTAEIHSTVLFGSPAAAASSAAAGTGAAGAPGSAAAPNSAAGAPGSAAVPDQPTGQS